ncbi:MAG: DUF2382 domain-containing protein [Solirubrobacteraceae bacterium]
MTETTEAYGWQGRNLLDSQGEKVGKIDQIYEDERTGKPEWALVNTGLFGTKSHFVPLAGASPTGEDVTVDVTKDQVKDAPSIDNDGELSQDEERRLFEHYGVPYTDEGSVSAEGAAGGDSAPLAEPTGESGYGNAGRQAETGHDTSGPTTDDAMTRSEEELRVGTERREAGRARLRKYVVTEEVTQTVPVQREEVRLEREPITDDNRDQALDGPGISEEEHEVVLHEEQPVVEKQTVPKERVRLDTDVVSEEREVSEEVRKERIESDAPENRAS